MRKVLSTVFIVTSIGLTMIAVDEYVDSFYSQQQAEAEWTGDSEAPWTVSKPKVRPPSDAVFARLFFPRIDIQRFVIANATKKNLRHGPSWLAETVRPGDRGNCVIAGHRDTHFRALKDVKAGDEIVVDYGERVFTYRVKSMQVVQRTDTKLLRPTHQSVLTLVTCYPFYFAGPAPKRFIVRAELAETQITKAAQTGL
jgi:sortase A